METEKKEVIFKIKNLKTWFPITKGFMKKVVGNVKAVDDVSIEVYKGETLGIVGESGCGKSTFGKTVMMLEKPTGGEVLFNYNGEYKDITKFNKDEMFEFRKKVQMVFQDPYSALNPQKKIYTSFEEPLKTHGVDSVEEREKIMNRVLKMVNIQPDYLMRFPHEFSGGQRQRLCIARALEVTPEVLICDEPVSALDVSIQAQVLNLMKEIQKELNLTYLFIAHDLLSFSICQIVSWLCILERLWKWQIPKLYMMSRFIRIQKHCFLRFRWQIFITKRNARYWKERYQVLFTNQVAVRSTTDALTVWTSVKKKILFFVTMELTDT